ncbi:hypothetical protein [Mycoplasmopsis cynos]|nr:hypothetical protein [Mycoplasmopsis cynos]UWV77084.1 hypothetical protein NW070_04880 [Mycoplasmopsis cynos]
MLGFLEKRIQKTLDKVSKKINLSEADILEVTRDIKLACLKQTLI